MNHLITRVADAELSYSPEPAVDEHPPTSAGVLEFEPVAGANVGIWEIEPGVARFDDEDEVFVVMSGSATLTFTRSGDTLDIGPGSVVRLYSGQQTRWQVHQTLRKVYVSE